MRFLFAAVGLMLVASAVKAEFENLSNDEIENLIKSLDYMEEYKREDASAPMGYEADYQMPLADYYDELANEVNTRQAELESHGSPFSASGAVPVPHAAAATAPVSHAAGGTTKANPKNAGAVLPAYCDPPNPCPIGYTSKDGCLEDFENTSEFSRHYQAEQNCLCDSEHMFNCPMEEQDQPRAQHEPFLAGMPPSLTSELEPENPFLAGHKLPVAAKKGLGY